jgi:IstB-like ATP binding protein
MRRRSNATPREGFWARLVDEHGAVGLSYSTVRDHLRKRRPQILAEAGRPLELGYVPQTHRPAAEAEVDFHDLWVVLRGINTKTALFTMRLSYSGRAAHKAFLTQGQEAFLEGHVYALDRLGGVPADKIRYDNLNSAVKQVLFGRSRQENERWISFKSHSGTDKSHLLIALGTLAAEAGYRVRYTLASKLVNELVEAADDKQLIKLINRYGRVDLILVDELGYLRLDRRGAELLFQVLTEREERSAIAIASNEPFSSWTKTFTDPRLCAAIVDRLTFAGQIIETGSTSYRLAHARNARPAS